MAYLIFFYPFYIEPIILNLINSFFFHFAIKCYENEVLTLTVVNE